MKKDKLNKLTEAFGFDFILFSDEYFEDENNVCKIAQYQTTKEELIKLQLSEAIKNIKTSKRRIFKDLGTYQDFPHAIDLQITTVYCPDEKYLTNAVELFELLTEPNNKKYLDYIILYDPEIFWDNPRSHSRIVSILASDNKYFVCDSDSNGNRKIIDSDSRFTGILPFLLNNRYNNLYERMIKVVFKIAEDYSLYVGKMILSLYNFLLLNDENNWKLFDSIFKNIVKDQLKLLSGEQNLEYSKLYFRDSDITKFNSTKELLMENGLCFFTAPEAVGKYGRWFGNGFEFKKEYANCSIAQLLE